MRRHSSRAALDRRAFSLVELLVVIAILSILMGILLPSLNKVRELAWRNTCLSNVKEIAKSCTAYASNESVNRGLLYALPNAGVTTGNWGTKNPESLYLLIKCGMASKTIFLCPHAGVRQELHEPADPGFTAKTYSYSYMSQAPITGYNETLTIDKDLGTPAIIADKNPRYTFSGGAVSGEDGKNSKNHDRKGQNVAQVNGSGRWLTNTKLENDDIYRGGSGDVRATLSDSFVCP